MLPTPLSVSRPTPAAPTPSVSTIAISRSSEDGYNSDVGSQQRLVSPNESEDYERYQTPNSFEARVSRSGGVLRQSTMSSSFPGETPNPYSYTPQTAGFDDPGVPFAAEPEDMQPSPNNNRGRGISLSDNGPVPGPGGVRRVSRQQNRRPSSQAPPPPQNPNRYSRTFTNLPPGAAPPASGYGY